MSEMVKSKASVLLGVVPLFAVTRLTLNESYSLPSVGDKGLSQSTSKVVRSVQIEAALIGDDRQAVQQALEEMADLSRTLPLVSSLISGIPLVAGLATFTDMQVESLNFSQSADEKEVYSVSISLKHCPRPGLAALLGGIVSAAASIGGTADISSSTPRRP